MITPVVEGLALVSVSLVYGNPRGKQPSALWRRRTWGVGERLGVLVVGAAFGPGLEEVEVGPVAEQEPAARRGPGYHLAPRGGRGLVAVGHSPAAVGEPVPGVLVRPGGCLDHAVERDAADHGDCQSEPPAVFCQIDASRAGRHRRQANGLLMRPGETKEDEPGNRRRPGSYGAGQRDEQARRRRQRRSLFGS
jgi:hypothetical protein